ncbi:hypothetical protein TNCV_281931 [Trichonephila clavipes]|nr:hypothetical protein TNCV_281931 [Trichonephila clavipes]
MSRKKTIGYKRLLDSGSGGQERKQRKGQNHPDEKRHTSGYNLRPRRGVKVESRPTIEMRTQGGPFRARKRRENCENPPEDSTLNTKIDLRKRTTRRHFYNNKLNLFT